MSTRHVQVLRVDVEMDEAGRMSGAWVTIAKAEDPTRLVTRKFPDICAAFDDILSKLLGAKLQQVAEEERIPSRAGSA